MPGIILGQSILEAEDAYYSSGTIDSEHIGFTGSGFVNTDNAVGEFIEWFINLDAASDDTLDFRYALGKEENRYMEVYVNQVLIDTIDFDNTTDFTNYIYKSVPYSLPAGLSRIKLVSINPEGAPNVDHLRIMADTSALPYYDLNITAGTGGSISSTAAADSVQAGKLVEVTAVPDAGYSFSGWTGDTIASTNPLNLLVDQDYTLQANFSFALPAFPGAEGFGRFTTGGRGGAVIEVTNLNDSGSGSLRAAVNTPGARTIVFRVSGTIYLNSPLSINQGDVTIAGQTAPGDGICLANYTLSVNANNVIIRYIRSRMGDNFDQEADAFSARYVSNMIIDHCSFSWGIDEVASMYLNHNTSFQWNIVSESFFRSVHDKGDHGYGGIWGGDSASFLHNMLIHHTSRNPRFNGARYELGWNEYVDFRNNAIYNWGFNSAYGGDPNEDDGAKAHINVVNNYYKYGPATGAGSMKYRVVNPSGNGQGYSLWYVDGNYTWGYPQVTEDNWRFGVQGLNQTIKDEIKVDDPFPFHTDSTMSAEVAFEHVLARVGAVLPARDANDSRLVMEACTGTAAYGGAYSNDPVGIIDSQGEVGGWPTLNSTTPPDDTDHDGMPDAWETNRGLNPNDPTDRNGDDNNNGYTNLEEYLNSLVEAFTYVLRPIEVTAEVVDDEISLSWTDISDSEDAYILERELDEGGYTQIAVLPANTTSYTDQQLPDGYYSYRLRSASPTDTSCYTDPVLAAVTTGIDEAIGNLAELSFYPNPADETLNIDLTLRQPESLRIELLSLQGQFMGLLDQPTLGAGSHQFQVALPANLAAGVYTLRIQTSEGVANLKLMKR